MKVYKFGGASIATPERAKALLPIIKIGEPLLLVISALGKTTNALEKIVNSAYEQQKNTANELCSSLEAEHIAYAEKLLNATYASAARSLLGKYFQELYSCITATTNDNYDLWYDQIVSMGELFSTLIMSCYLQQEGVSCEWLDARSVIRTDNNFRDAGIDWSWTKMEALSQIETKLKAGKTVLTQGFIGSTREGLSVTLGREGSDYTAAVLAAMLNADSVTIWKDVEGFLNADPKLFDNTVKIETLTYNEVIEMAFYGAQIIHPKTIKPLQNNNIPLYVKCFLDPSLSGTTICGETKEIHYPPLIVLKKDQLLLQVTTRDFSFITEDNLSKLYAIFHKLRIKINLIQNAAISFVACIDNRTDKVKLLTEALAVDYKVLVNEDVNLLTIRHYTPEKAKELVGTQQILLKQETRKTIQMVLKNQ